MKITTFIDAPTRKVFEGHNLPRDFLAILADCQMLAVAVNLQGHYAVLLETTQHGIFCHTWLAAHSAQHESHHRFDCFYRKDPALIEICDHLRSLLNGSQGGAV